MFSSFLPQIHEEVSEKLSSPALVHEFNRLDHINVIQPAIKSSDEKNTEVSFNSFTVTARWGGM